MAINVDRAVKKFIMIKRTIIKIVTIVTIILIILKILKLVSFSWFIVFLPYIILIFISYNMKILEYFFVGYAYLNPKKPNSDLMLDFYSKLIRYED